MPLQPHGGFCPSEQMKGLPAWSAALGHPSMTSAGVHGYSPAQGITCIKTPPKIADGPSGNVTNPSWKPPGFALERSLLMLLILTDGGSARVVAGIACWEMLEPLWKMLRWLQLEHSLLPGVRTVSKRRIIDNLVNSEEGVTLTQVRVLFDTPWSVKKSVPSSAQQA